MTPEEAALVVTPEEVALVAIQVVTEIREVLYRRYPGLALLAASSYPNTPAQDQQPLSEEMEDLPSEEYGDEFQPMDVDDLSYDDLLQLGEQIGNVVELGLSPYYIARHLKKAYKPKNFAAEEDDICVICQEEYDETEILVGKLDCGHVFHEGCIESWLLKKNECPICRREGLKETKLPPWMSVCC